MSVAIASLIVDAVQPGCVVGPCRHVFPVLRSVTTTLRYAFVAPCLSMYAAAAAYRFRWVQSALQDGVGDAEADAASRAPVRCGDGVGAAAERPCVHHNPPAPSNATTATATTDTTTHRRAPAPRYR
ncbi:hypothetical protein GCM10022220_29230 [Actinocatenispora rupis]|uniref:Uncharacterized protein n=1 Tax=Actinocatenispora rupis TaxID=519421 RepID=A0A8J3NEX3_9ACTN|nr:hypothetical protein Aru02nite_39830 [Actinocatenispora rupis]